MRRRLPPALRIREFALLWSSMLTNGLASQMLAVAIGWQVYEIRHNPLDLGLIGLMEFLPLPVLALPAGQIADRLPRRAVTAASYVLSIGIASALVAVTASGADRLWPYLVLAAVAGVASVFGNPAARALTRELVTEDLIPGAMALRGVAGQIGLIAGPALGGVIFAIEPVAVYATAAGLLTLSLGAVLAMRPSTQSLVTTEPPGWDSLVAGVRFILRTRTLLGAIALDLFAVLLGDAIALAPVFAITILHTGPIGLGLLRTSPSVGALAAALILTRRPLRRPAGPTLLVVVGTFGAATIVFGLSKWLPLSMAALMVTGFVDMISMNIRSTAVAMLTPPQLQGRVAAVEWVFIGASNELGAFWSGALARLIGTVPAVVAGGASMIGIAVSWTRLFPALARLGRLEDLRPEPA
ncbi:MAG TPA: MFS transporter [Gaiellaceae bacterium]|jgi:MFS family permease|nr:MFS transporter [Gaiellaceae bacterium]